MATTPARKSIRLEGYDYSEPGGYFVTICSYQRKLIFGEVKEQLFLPTGLGRVVIGNLGRLGMYFRSVRVGEFAVMPNHLHMLVYFSAQAAPNRTTLPMVISRFKALVTNHAHKIHFDEPIWQRNYYEHVVRDSKDEQRIIEYIQMNPLLWPEDENNPEKKVSSRQG